jgi:hypothetical protein
VQCTMMVQGGGCGDRDDKHPVHLMQSTTPLFQVAQHT